MTLIGYAVLVGVPVISTAWVELLGFTESQVGRVAGADLGGLSLGAVIASLFVARMNRRLLVLVAVAIVIVSNGLCMLFTDYETVLWLRVGAGVGSGIYTAVAVATLGASSKPARAFNLMLFAFAFSQALEMQVLPMLSMNGIYLTFIACYLVGLPFLHWLPSRPLAKSSRQEDAEKEDARGNKSGSPRVPAYIPWLVLAAIFFARTIYGESNAAQRIEAAGITSPFVAAFAVPLKVDTVGDLSVAPEDVGSWWPLAGYLSFTLLLGATLLGTMVWLFRTRWRVAV